MSDHVAVVEAWEWPDLLADVIVNDLRAAQAAVREDGPWQKSSQAARWVGKPIARALKLDPDKVQDQNKVKHLLKVWIGRGMFVVATGKNEKGRDTPMVEVGEAATD